MELDVYENPGIIEVYVDDFDISFPKEASMVYPIFQTEIRI